MSSEDGNVQDMYVGDKEHPALAATEEAQDVSSLAQNVVPMGTYTDPNNPDAAKGSVNLSLNAHPVEHSDDYGRAVAETTGMDSVHGVVDVESEGAGFAGAEGEDRSEWTKEDWKAQASAYDLPVSGNKAELQARVEEYEAAPPEADEGDEE